MEGYILNTKSMHTLRSKQLLLTEIIAELDEIKIKIKIEGK